MLLKRVSRIHIFVLIIATMCNPLRAFTWKQIGIGAAVGTVIAAGIGAIILDNAARAAETAKEAAKRDADLLAKAQKMYEETTFLQSYVDIYVNSTLSHSAMNEDYLYEFLHVSLNNTAFSKFERNVNDALRTLDSAKQTLNERLKRSTQPLSMAEKNMAELSEKISQWKDHLNSSLTRLIEHHGTYFKLVQYAYATETQYSNEFATLKACGYNKELCEAAIKPMVARCKNSRRYPFAIYYEELVYDQNQLQYFVNRLSHAYPKLIEKTHQLISDLEYIRSIIVTTAEYTHDKQQKEQDAVREAQRKLEADREQFKRDQERLQREKEQARREQENARWEQEKARIALEAAQTNLAIQRMAFNTAAMLSSNNSASNNRVLVYPHTLYPYYYPQY